MNLIKIICIQVIVLFPLLAFAEVNERIFQIGVGYSRIQFNAEEFRSSPTDTKGAFTFDAFQFRMAAFKDFSSIRLGAEFQYHKSLQNRDTTTGSFGLEEYEFNLPANFNIWQGLCIEFGVVAFTIFSQPNREFNSVSGVGWLGGLSYVLNAQWELRMRREDKVLLSGDDIQPSYSMNISYQF
ncbi:MAG: hypothetical protein ACK4VO_09780 [Pseudobdellovibrio sp.]